jgi:hypothetical protein
VKWNIKGKVAAGVGAVCVLAFGAFTSLHDRSFHERPFDSDVWKPGNARVRGEMVESLRSQSLLRDKTRLQVLELLGKPDADDEGHLLRYRVDVGRRIAWRRFLVTFYVSFDENSRVYRVEMID